MEMEGTYRKHLICFVEDKHFDVVSTERTTVLDHIQYTTWSTDDDVDALLEDSDIFTDDSSTNTSMTLILTRL
jgi:hypothetical protein